MEVSEYIVCGSIFGSTISSRIWHPGPEPNVSSSRSVQQRVQQNMLQVKYRNLAETVLQGDQSCGDNRPQTLAVRNVYEMAVDCATMLEWRMFAGTFWALCVGKRLRSNRFRVATVCPGLGVLRPPELLHRPCVLHLPLPSSAEGDVSLGATTQSTLMAVTTLGNTWERTGEMGRAIVLAGKTWCPTAEAEGSYSGAGTIKQAKG